MTPLAIALCIFAQFFLVGGQLFFKHAMDEKSKLARSKKIRLLLIGIAAQAVWFFLWLGLLQHWPLSQIFPFEGLNPLLLVLAAWLALHERLTPSACLGVVLITAGLVLVVA